MSNDRHRTIMNTHVTMNNARAVLVVFLLGNPVPEGGREATEYHEQNESPNELIAYRGSIHRFKWNTCVQESDYADPEKLVVLLWVCRNTTCCSEQDRPSPY
jgi:hypothetical protein